MARSGKTVRAAGSLNSCGSTRRELYFPRNGRRHERRSISDFFSLKPGHGRAGRINPACEPGGGGLVWHVDGVELEKCQPGLLENLGVRPGAALAGD